MGQSSNVQSASAPRHLEDIGAREGQARLNGDSFLPPMQLVDGRIGWDPLPRLDSLTPINTGPFFGDALALANALNVVIAAYNALLSTWAHSGHIR